MLSDPRPAEASVTLLAFFLLPLCVVASLVPGSTALLQIPGTVMAIPNIPILLLAQGAVLPPHQTIVSQGIEFLRRLCRLLITDYFFLRCLDTHDAEGRRIPLVRLFRSAEELEGYLSDLTYRSYCVVVHKMDIFSRGAPCAFPATFNLCSSNTSAMARGSGSVVDGVVSPTNAMLMTGVLPLRSQHRRASNALQLPQPTVDVFIAQPTTPHQLLTIPTHSSDVSTQPAVASRPPTRLHPAALAAVGWNTTTSKRTASGLSPLALPFSQRIKRGLGLVAQKGVMGMMRDVERAASGTCSQVLLRLLPASISTYLTTATCTEERDIAAFLLWNRSPLQSLGLDAECLVNSMQVCRDPACGCTKGMVVNYWTYAVLLGVPSNKIWTLYTTKGLETLNSLYHILSALRLVQQRERDESPKTNTYERASACYTLPLEALIHFESLYRSIETTFPDLPRYMPLDRLARLAMMVRQGTQSSRGTLRSRSTQPQVHDGYAMDIDFTTRLLSSEYDALVSQCAGLAESLSFLAVPFCRGLAQWSHIAKLFKCEDKVFTSLRQLGPVLLKVTEAVHYFVASDALQSWQHPLVALEDEMHSTLDVLSVEYTSCFSSESLEHLRRVVSGV